MNTSNTSVHDSSKQQIKNFIDVVYEYFLRRNDKVFSQLQRQLQLLSVVDNLEIFEPSCMETLEFYSCVEQLIESEEKIGWKAVTLINYMAQSETVLLALRDEIKMVPILCGFLLDLKPYSDKYIKTLSLFNKITRGILLDRGEAWVLRLLPHLVQVITENSPKNSSDDRSDDSLTILCLSTLNNLCRNNPVVVHCLKTWTSLDRLLGFIPSQTSGRQTQLLCLELYLHIQKTGPVWQWLAVVFQVCRESIRCSDGALVLLCSDALKSVYAVPELRPKVISFGHYERECRDLLEAINASASCPVPEVACFLSSLLTLDVPALKVFYPQIILKSVEWTKAGDSDAACIQLLHSLLNIAEDEQLYNHVENFISAAKSLLVPTTILSLRSLSKIVDALHTLQSLVSRQLPTIAPAVSLSLSPSLFAHLLPTLTDFSAHMEHLTECGALVTRRCNETTSAPHPDYSSANITLNTKPVSLNKSASSSVYCSNAGTQLCSEAVLRLLCVMKALGKHDKSFLSSYNKMMSTGSLMSHATRCLLSRNRDLVELAAILLMPNEDVTPQCVSAFVNCTLEANLAGLSNCGPDTPSVDSLDSSGQDFNGTLKSDIASSGELCSNIDQILAKLKGISEVAEMKNHPLTEVVDLYEFKMASMEHCSQAMTELLANADAKCKVLERNVLVANAESTRVRQLLRSWQQRLEECQSEKTAALEKGNSLKEEFKAAREALSQEKTVLERESSRLRSTINSLQAELQGKEEKIAAAVAQHNKYLAEIKLFKKAVDAEKNKYRDLKTKYCSLEETNQNSLREVEALQRTGANLEKSIETLKQENKDLEKLLRECEKSLRESEGTVAEKDKQIEELAKTTENLKRMRDMIYNISANVPT